MTFRVRHEWPAAPTRILTAETASCPHCGTLRVTEAGRVTRYLRPTGPEVERDSFVEPPCIELPKRRTSRQRNYDRLGAPIGGAALEKATRDAIDRRNDQE